MKVFVSHASEDKPRFVLGFAEKLRAAGIDAWLDRWEMLPGDSVVDKLFAEGLANADAVVVVLSKFSVDKPWVREEMNAALMKRVEAKLKVVPVVLDDCRVPEALATTLWERITDLEHYDESFERIVAALTGVHEKPALGTLPAFAQPLAVPIPGLAPQDDRVLQALGALALRLGYDSFSPGELQQDPVLSALPQQEVLDSLEMLESEALVRTEALAPGLPSVGLETAGLRRWAEACLPGYAALLKAVGGAIANEGVDSNEALCEKLGQPRVLVNHALEVLEGEGLVTVARYGGGLQEVVGTSARLRRWLGA